MKRTAPLTALALATGLALAGCAGGGQTTDSATASPTAAAGAQTGTAAAGATDSGTSEAISAEHSNQDTMFAQMMIPHHQQAVDMSENLLAKNDIPANVRDFAQKVIDAQGPEIDQLNAMLSAWGEEPTMSASSDGMGHGSMGHGSDSGSGMGGMMSEDDMQALDDAQGTEAARLYLEQMTTHHRGAIEMAREEVSGGQNPQAVELAQKIVEDQEAEITQMEEMLKELPSS